MSTEQRSLSRSPLGLLAFFILCAGAAGLGSVFTMAGMDGWYEGIERPDWQPPDWVFGPVWTILYAGMAIAAWLVWRCRSSADVRLPLSLFAIQLVLNVLWTAIFFGLQSPGSALLEIVLLWLAIVATMLAFWPISRVATAIMLPYLGWVTFATALNYSIWSMN